MVDPRFALSVFAVLVAVTALLVWPRYGLITRVARMWRSTERVLLEDALKHSFTCESVGRECSIESIAGQLEISTGRAANLLSRLVESDLVRSGDSGLALTEAGRESALRLVRTHRLWERYLADRTGVPAGEWHARAEDMEHTLSTEQTEELAARLGHPKWDPHGDPIPSPGGELPTVEQASLADARAGRTFEIVHLEDEPREIYDALLEDGFGLGARLEVIERSGQVVRVKSAGKEWPIGAVVARNVTVRELPEGVQADGPLTTLRDLRPGEGGIVLGLSPACRGSQRRRLLDLGVVKGTEILSEMVAATGDPVAYRIRGALIALRGEQAEWVRIERVEAPAEVLAQ